MTLGALTSAAVAFALLAGSPPLTAQPSWTGDNLPLVQSKLARGEATPHLPFTLRDASRDDRWLGLGVRTPRWDPMGEWLYFRWDLDPQPEEDPESDPWFRVSRDGNRVEVVPDNAVERVPGEEVVWDPRGERCAWTKEEGLFLWEPDRGAHLVYRSAVRAANAHFGGDGGHLYFQLGSDLYEYDLSEGSTRQLTRVWTPNAQPRKAQEWLAQQQLELFDRHRQATRLQQDEERRARQPERLPMQTIPVAQGWEVDRVTRSPDGRFLTVRFRRRPPPDTVTHYLDFVSRSGYAEVEEARPKVGEPQAAYRLGIVRFAPETAPEEVKIAWVEGPRDERGTLPFGPYWSPGGDHALVQFVSLGFKDRWIGWVDLSTGAFRELIHDHDDAWLGGPPPVAGYLNPALLEWLSDGSFVFASERTGWSHLYRGFPDGRLQALTQGEWEVRGAALSRDRTTWLIQASREHPSDDHLYRMPAAGGPLMRLTEGQGRFEGWLSPDGERLAVIHSETVHLPDLFLQGAQPGADVRRVTKSGADSFYSHALIRPQIVSFPHPDGKPVYAALYLPLEANRNRAAVLHIHGGGYRQFSHRGWSVYGWEMHLGLIHYLVEQGNTVLDFDYRGGAGYGRDYRTDIYRSMGHKDVQGAVAAVNYLVDRHGVDRARIGIYGLSYGGFFTLAALFRHPGVFAAGIANASVTDWAHYNHPWTARVLNLPFLDPEAYRISSPIYFAEGLQDPLLIVHGLIDDNVHFQDSARLIQRLIELEKDFEVMIYPMERHVIRSESSRYDYVRRAVRFFRMHLLEKE